MRYTPVLGAVVLGLYFLHAAFTPAEPHFIDTVNLIFHEAGHTIFGIFGQFIGVLMGSGFQALLPVALAGYFFATSQRLGAGAMLLWAGQSMTNVSVYARDAIRMQLPLLGGDSVMHDWNYLLSALGILRWAEAVGTGIYIAGLVLAFVGAGLLLYSGVYEKRA